MVYENLKRSGEWLRGQKNGKEIRIYSADIKRMVEKLGEIVDFR